MYKLTPHWPQNLETGAYVNPETNKDYLQWLSEGNIPGPIDPPTIGEQRAELQTIRDNALATMFYDFGDGRVMRTTSEDEQNIKKRIDKNQTKKWVMVDSSVADVSPEELQTALDAAVITGEQIWDDYMAALEAL